MNRPNKQIIFLTTSIALIALAAGFLAGIRFEEGRAIKQTPRSRVVLDDGSSGVTFYTYYIGVEGEEVLHGWKYIVINGSVAKKLYEDGNLVEVSGSSIRQ